MHFYSIRYSKEIHSDILARALRFNLLHRIVCQLVKIYLRAGALCYVSSSECYCAVAIKV